jgi:hypothetical protein
MKTQGFRTWTEEDIAAFEATHPIGTRARLALALLLYTAGRSWGFAEAVAAAAKSNRNCRASSSP